MVTKRLSFLINHSPFSLKNNIFAFNVNIFIDYLKEFKQGLISDAVTGLICVAEPQKGDTQ